MMGMSDYNKKRRKRVTRLVALGVGFGVFVILNVAVPPESRSEITFLILAGFAYGITLLLFTFLRSSAAGEIWARLRIRSRVYYMSRTKITLIWVGAILISILSFIGGIVSRGAGARFFLTYLIPIALIAAVSLMSVEGNDEPKN